MIDVRQSSEYGCGKVYNLPLKKDIFEGIYLCLFYLNFPFVPSQYAICCLDINMCSFCFLYTSLLKGVQRGLETLKRKIKQYV